MKCLIKYAIMSLIFSNICFNLNAQHIIDTEFLIDDSSDNPNGLTPPVVIDFSSDVYNSWSSAGSEYPTHTILEIDITNIEPIVCLNDTTSKIDTTYFVSATPNDDYDDSAIINELISFIYGRGLNLDYHVRINFPPGLYRLNSKITMRSNISLKGAGSDSTSLFFDIRDTQNNTMSIEQYRSNCFEIIDESNVGIEDLKISRSHHDANFVGAVFDSLTVFIEINIHTCYHNDSIFHDRNDMGNNILLNSAYNCWITGVESNKPYRNHVYIQGDYTRVTNHVTVSGCLFDNAANQGGGGFGYGTYLGDLTEKCLIENNIFLRLRHGIVLADRSKFNVVGYNYIREPINSDNSDFLRGKIYWRYSYTWPAD